MQKTLRALILFLMLIICTAAQADWIELTSTFGEPINPPNGNFIPTALAGNSTYLFATTNGELHRSADQGANWTAVGVLTVYAVAANDAHLFAGNNYFRHSADNGDSWTYFGQLPQTSDSRFCSGLAIQGNYLFAATYGGKYYKRPLYELSGVTPTAATAANITATDFDAGWNVSTGDLGYSLDVATDAAFTALVDGYSNKDVGNVTAFNVTGLTAGTAYYYRVRAINVHGTSESSNTVTLQTLTTSALAPADLPTATELNGNYPNPFNPTTAIDYDLAKNSPVKLTVYNASGELVKTLVNTTQNAGKHSVNFDGAGLNSGTYFYKLEVDGKCLVNRMLMVK